MGTASVRNAALFFHGNTFPKRGQDKKPALAARAFWYDGTYFLFPLSRRSV